MTNSASSPIVTIDVPVYNGGAYLDEAVTSMRQQSLGDIEILICDNAADFTYDPNPA